MTDWSSPAKLAAAWPPSRLRCKAASRSPAGQPSVRSTSSAASSAPTSRPCAAEQVGRVGGAESQVARAQLTQLVVQPQPMQRQRRVRPGEQEEPQLLDLVAQQRSAAGARRARG